MMKTILIVEHAATHRDLLVHCLRDDYTVVTAADGATGVELAEQTEPDLIFMALALPVLGGDAAIHRIKAQRRLHDIPIIALTAQTMHSEAASAWAAGCVDLLHTPIDEDRLYATVRKFLGGG
jgi:CheY-like chemotaxis protein